MRDIYIPLGEVYMKELNITSKKFQKGLYGDLEGYPRRDIYQKRGIYTPLGEVYMNG